MKTDDRNEKGQFTKDHVPWLKGIKGLKPWHNISGLRPPKKGEYKHKPHSIRWMSIVKKEQYRWKGLVPWNKGLHIQLNTGRTHFKKKI